MDFGQYVSIMLAAFAKLEIFPVSQENSAFSEYFIKLSVEAFSAISSSHIQLTALTLALS